MQNVKHRVMLYAQNFIWAALIALAIGYVAMSPARAEPQCKGPEWEVSHLVEYFQTLPEVVVTNYTKPEEVKAILKVFRSFIQGIPEFETDVVDRITIVTFKDADGEALGAALPGNVKCYAGVAGPMARERIDAVLETALGRQSTQ